MTTARELLHAVLVLAALLATAKLLGYLARRVGQPPVLGELLAGVILGGSVLGLLDPSTPLIQALSELGVMVLLFHIGLHTNLRSMAAVAGTAAVVALVGVIVPFALGYLAATRVLGLGPLPALVCGAALTATSIGISARVLSDLRQLESREGQIVLAAAVLDDIIGLTILAVVTTIALGGSLSPSKVAFPAESALIVGSFGAGMILNATALRPTIDFVVTRIGYVLVPIFFASVGAAVVLSSFTEAHTLAAGGLLIGVGVLGKFVSGYAPWRFKGNKTLIGVAMIPRGEVGLIFAQMGLSTGAIDAAIFSALTLMVMVTTFLAPPLLTVVGKRSP